MVCLLIGSPLANRLMATSYIWDVVAGNGERAFEAGSGEWDLTKPNWNVEGEAVVWANAEDREMSTGATFRGDDSDAGSSVISVDKQSAVRVTVLTFTANGYLLKGGAEGTVLTVLSAKNANAGLSIYPGKVAVFGDRLTLAVQGTFQVSCPVKNSSSTGEIIFGKGSAVTLLNNMSINGAAVRFNEGSLLEGGPSSSLLIGEFEKTSSSTLTVDGGHLSVGGGSITVGKALAESHGVATLTLISGSIEATREKSTAGELRLGVATTTQGTGVGVVNLFGVTLTVARIYQDQADMAATLNFDGGTLRVKTPTAYADNFLEGLNAVYVGAKGAIIDTNGVDVVVWQPLLRNGEGDGVIDGGLVKQGQGRLTLGGRSTFTGPLKVEAGEVRLSGPGALASIAGIDVAKDTVLDLSLDCVPHSVGGLRGSGAISLSAGRTLNVSSGGTVAPGGAGVGNTDDPWRRSYA